MIHFISKFDPIWHTERYIADALEWHGQNVQCYDVSDETDRPGCIKPHDMVLTSVPQMIGVDYCRMVKNTGAKLVCWYFDWIQGYLGRDEKYLPRLSLMDAIYSTDGFSDDWYKSQGITTRTWLPQAAPQDESLIDVTPGAPEHDVLFIGRVYNHNREQLINELRRNYSVGVYGKQTNGRFIWGKERQSLIRNAKVVLGTSYRDDVPGYWSNRVYPTLSAGGLYLCPAGSGIERQFTPGKHIVTYTGDACKAIDKLLKKTAAKREKVRQNGYEFVRARHTYLHRVGSFVSDLRTKGMLP